MFDSTLGQSFNAKIRNATSTDSNPWHYLHNLLGRRISGEGVFFRSLKSSHLQIEAQPHSDLSILIICTIPRLKLFRNYLTEMGLGPCIGRIFRKENLSFHVVNVIYCYTSNVMKLFLSFPGERKNYFAIISYKE